MTELEHRGYVGSVELSEADNVLHGKLLHIRDLVTYESETANGIVEAFREAVEDYLADCAAEGREPDMPFKGSLNVRIGSDLHRRLSKRARADRVSLNQALIEALTKGLEHREFSALFSESVGRFSDPVSTHLLESLSGRFLHFHVGDEKGWVVRTILSDDPKRLHPEARSEERSKTTD